MKFRLSLISTFALFAGCASVGVTRLKQAERYPINCVVDVYTSEVEVKHEHESVCLIDSKTAQNAFADKTMSGAIKQLQPEACKCGAHAIVLMGGRSEGANLSGWGQGFATVKAIRYLDVTKRPSQVVIKSRKEQCLEAKQAGRITREFSREECR